MSESKPKSSLGCVKAGYAVVGKLFTTFGILILIILITLCLILTWIGLSTNGLPEFGDPYLGFQTRFTPISNRLVTLENLRLELNRMNILENYPGERVGEKESRKKRNLRSSSSSMCANSPLDDYGRIALELKGVASASVLSRETLSLICYFQHLVSSILTYDLVCEYDENRRCCPMWSLPNYVAQYSNKSDCLDLQDEDVKRFGEGLRICNNIYLNSTLNEDCLNRQKGCLAMCHYGEILQAALSHTIDTSLVHTNTSQYAMIILPVPKSTREEWTMKTFQKEIWNLRTSLPQQITTLAGYDFGSRNAVFEGYLVSDLQYVAVASILIFSIVFTFTKSVFVTVISFGNLILSLGVSYYLYKSVFLIPYFPFMNMLVTIIILGIGTDATLIVSSAWKRESACAGDRLGRSRREFIMTKTLMETTVTLVITTCTTAGAFFASLMSSITTIRCFSIYAGTAIITSFVLLYISVPISIDCSTRFWNYFTELFPLPSQSKLFTKMIALFKFPHPCCPLFKSSKLVLKVSSSILFWTCSFIVFATILLISIIIVFISPSLQLPTSEQFQLLSASHPIEVFDRIIKPAFSEGSAEFSDEKLTVYIIWGLRPIDTGNGLDPSNTGMLNFDPTFVLETAHAQRWMKKLCRRIQRLKFYDQIENDRVGLNLDSCFMDTLVTWMKRDCHHYVRGQGSYKPCCNSSKFPYINETLHECIGYAARDVYRTPSMYFHPDVAGPKFFVHRKGKNNLATFTIRIRTNISYSVTYDKMDKIYKEFEQHFEEILKDAPPGLENGFFVSSHFDFYDLQKSLIEETWSSLLLSIGLCFVFLLVSSRSVTIASGAVICIFSIVVVTSAIMIEFFSWKLGVFESIAATVAVGLSDFTAHHSIEFAKQKSVTNITTPTFFSAISTVVMGLCMYLFSSVLVYEQIGSFFFVLVLTSWTYSVFFLTPILMFLDNLTRVVMATVGKILPRSQKPTHDDDEDDARSHSDLIMENVTVTQRPEKRPSNAMMDMWKQLKKFGQETPV